MPDPQPSAADLDAWATATVRRALAYALTLVPNRSDAEDIVHDCYSRLLARSSEYDLPRDGSKLLFKAITNACINWTQRRPPVVGWGTGGVLPFADKPETEPERRAMRNELDEAIRQSLAELPVKQRAVVELRSWGHSLIEVAEMLDISHDNARTLLHRARTTLAKKLQPYIEEQTT